MKIFSAYHDYYDSVQAFDPDPLCVYERKCEEIEISTQESDLLPQQTDNGWYRTRHFNNVTERILGFCGKLYPFLWVDNNYPDSRIYKDGKKWLPKSPTGSLYFWDIQTFEKELRKNNFFNAKQKKYNLQWTTDGIDTHGKFLKEWSDFESKMFVNLRTPVFLTSTVSQWARNRGNEKVEVTLNPSLISVGFYRVKNPFEAYQEIEQFISGILGMNDPEMVEISNEDKIAKRGFNKMSFRKPPGKRKPRKQKIAEA